MPKKCSNYYAIALISQASKITLKILQVQLQSMWTMNFQMFKLDLEKAEETEIKLPTPLDHRKSKRIPEKHLFLLCWLCQSLWLYGLQQTVENSSGDGNTRNFTCLLRNLYAGQEVTVRARQEQWTGTMVPNWERSTSRLYIATLLI